MASTTTVEITMPQMGESVAEGTVVEWHKDVGEAVSANEPLVDVSTDKVDAEVSAPADGMLTEIKVGPDETVAAGAVLGIVEVGARPEGDGDGAAPKTREAPGDGAAGRGEGDEAPAGAGTAAEHERSAGAAEGGDGGPGAGPPSGELRDLVLPALGESVAEGTVLEWRKAVGDPVARDETLVEVSTDKVDAEVPSPADGTLAEILVQADETVAVGSVLGRVAAGAVVAPAPGGAPAAEPAEAAEPSAPAGDGRANATPVAARMASAHGLDLARITGTGPRGRITKNDVEAALRTNGGDASAAPAAPAAAAAAPAAARAPGAVAPPPGATTRPLRGPAATLARFMNESLSIPTATSFRTLAVDELDARRRALKAAGHRLSFTHLIAWALVQAAKDMPEMAQAYAEQDGKPLVVVPAGLGLGLAVDIERRDGTRFLVTPALRDAGELDLRGFVARYDQLVTGARDGTLAPEDYQGANITLTNPGGLGTVASVPRLMPGQGTIVATGAIGWPPGFANVDPGRLRELGVTKVMTMTSTYDHRVIQGAQSGAFLRRIDQLLQGEDGFYDAIFAALGVDPATVGAEPGGATAAEPVPARVAPAADGQVDERLLQAVQAATSVVKAHRTHGHLSARLDPLGAEPRGDPALDPETVNLTPELMARIPAKVLRVAVPGDTFAEALPELQETYTGTIAYEIEHISDHDQRVWLRQVIESGEHRQKLAPDDRRRLLERLVEVGALESYLHRTFLGKKRFSIEGLDVLVPMLDETIERAAAAAGREVVIGMAHRGRLNVLAHTVGRPYEALLVEFEGEKNPDAATAMPIGGTGDVKYHHGAAGTYTTRAGKGITVTLSPNPSHLEFVNPVVEGRARADQTSRKARDLTHDPHLVLPVLIHGDAAFPGQGVVAETLNLSALAGYSTGGTLHLITNNQLGFTTEPSESRSTRYASDLAKGFDIPIVHVNADDVEACIAAVRLAVRYRETFARDAVIDLIGYRRYGHNETDEPAYTQPEMYETIRKHPTVQDLYARVLVDDGVVSENDVEQLRTRATGRLTEAHDKLRKALEHPAADHSEPELDRSASHEPHTAVAADTLRELNEQLFTFPEGFTVNRKLRGQIERRRKGLAEDGPIEWSHAEELAFASLLSESVPVRLTGQDTERGTFSQRHLVFHDSKNGERFCPLQRLPGSTVPMELHNSPLSEIACLGFEYGYSVQAPEALVVWEAQFGDFVNSAQVVVDQFVVSGLAKWGQTSRLTLLLPHGYEGAGPEHSSARLERFLQQGAEGNIRVANCTTPAQYFHLLRRQALIEKRRPLVVVTPKSLLRLPAATSRLEDLASGSFHPVLDDPTLPGDREEVTRLVMCTGKVFYDIVSHERRAQARNTAVARVELLYPFAENELRALIDSYPNIESVTWAQEEPRNMGARALMSRRIEYLLPKGWGYEYVGRPLRASPSEGYPAAHLAEQARIAREALGLPEEAQEEAIEAVEETATADPGGSA